MSSFGYCDTCGAGLAPTIVPAREGKGINGHSVGLQCSAEPMHGPDLP